MKKIFTFFFAIALSLNMLGQCPLTTAVDFTATDCHGTEVHLFDILDGGQYVLIDFFYTTCGPCNTAAPKVVESYYAFGCNMYDVYYMEISVSDGNAACQNWVTTYGVEYPTIGTDGGGATICNTYGITAYPTVILIAPDHSIVINDLWPISNAQSIISALTPYGIQQHDCTAPGGDVIVDFTGTDLEGNEINLYSLLDAGQFVLINFFLAGDPYSQDIMSDMVDAYHLYGCNDHDVFFMEICPNGGNSTCQDWVETFNVEYPTISRDGGGNDIAQAIPVGYYPTIMLIRPDHTFAQRDIYPPTLDMMVQYMAGEGIQQYECNDGVDETFAEFTLYPNPVNDVLKINGENLGNVSVYNALGQKVAKFFAENELNIATSNYENGVYFVKIGEKTQRFVVTH